MKKSKRKMRKIKKRNALLGRVENFRKKEKETEKEVEEIKTPKVELENGETGHSEPASESYVYGKEEIETKDLKVDSDKEIETEDLRVDSDKVFEGGRGTIDNSELENKEAISDYDKRISDFEKIDSDKIKKLKVQRNIFIALFFLLLFLLVK